MGKAALRASLASYIAACCDHRSALAPGEVGVLPILAASTRQAQQLFNFISGIFATVPRFNGLLNDSTGDTLRLKTGVNITVTPASWRTIRSITAISGIGDEVAFWRDDNSVNPDEEIIGALKPALLTTGGMFIGLSSPYSQRGELFKAYKRHYGPEGDPRKLVVKAPSLTLNPSLPKEEIDLAYAEDPAKAAAEYGGEFRRDIEVFVSREALEACTTPDVTLRAAMAGYRYCAFVDPSGGSSDSMTLAICHKEGEIGVLDYVAEARPPFSPDRVVTDFAALLKGYGIKRVVGDRYGGEFVREPFWRAGIEYVLTELPKSQIYQAFLPLVMSARVELLDHPRMTTQFLGLERRTSRSGRDTIDHAPNAHDDVANAVAGALVEAVKFEQPAQRARWITSTHMAR